MPKVPALPLGLGWDLCTAARHPCCKGRQAAKGRHKLTRSQGRAVSAALPYTALLLPTGLSSALRCQSLPALSPASALSIPSQAVALVMQTHLPRLPPSWQEAAGLPAAIAAAMRRPHVPMSTQCSASASAPDHHTAATKSCCPADRDGRNRCVQLPQVTDQQITSTHRDLFIYF